MKITPFHTIVPGSTTQRTRRTSGTGASSFSSYLSESEETSELSEVAAPSAPSSLSGVLALQEISDEEMHRQKAFKQAHLTLDVLEELRNSLLMGEVPLHLLNRLAGRIAEQKKTISDPRLLDLMKDIELRASVELAKLENRK